MTSSRPVAVAAAWSMLVKFCLLNDPSEEMRGTLALVDAHMKKLEAKP